MPNAIDQTTDDVVTLDGVARLELEQGDGSVRRFVAEDADGGHAAAQRRALAQIDGDGGRVSLSQDQVTASLTPASRLVADDAGRGAAVGRGAPDELVDRVQASGGSDYVNAAARGMALSGAAGELNSEMSLPERGPLGGVLIPRQALAASALHGQPMTLAQVSTAAGDVMGDTGGMVAMPLRNMPLLRSLGISPTSVGEGKYRYARVTGEPSPATPAETKALTAGTFSLGFSDLSPRRLQVAATNTIEAEMVNSGLAAVLLSTMSSALDEKLQSEVMAALFGVGTAPSDASAVLDYAGCRKFVIDALDGKLSSMPGDLRLVVGKTTMSFADTLVQANTTESGLDYWRRATSGVYLSNDVPAVASKNEQVLVVSGSPAATASYKLVEWVAAELISANPAQAGALGSDRTYMLSTLFAVSVLPSRSFSRVSLQVEK